MICKNLVGQYRPLLSQVPTVLNDLNIACVYEENPLIPFYASQLPGNFVNKVENHY